MSNPEDWPGAADFGAIGGESRPIADGGTDPLAGVDDLTAAQTAVLLAVRHAGPLEQSELYKRGVVSEGSSHEIPERLAEAGLLEVAKPAVPNKANILYDPALHERPQLRILPDGGTDPLAGLERIGTPETIAVLASRLGEYEPIGDLTMTKTAILLAVRLVGPCPQRDLRDANVVAGGSLYDGLAELADAGLVKREDTLHDLVSPMVWDPETQTLERATIMTDGGRIQRGVSGDTETVEAKATMPKPMLRALDDFVDAGAYTSRSEAMRAALRRELRRTSADPDDLSRAVQQLYDDILQGDRPEAVAQCEQVAQRLGVTLTREVLR